MDVMKVKSPKQMMNFENKEKDSYILEFVLPKGFTTTPILKGKELKDRCPFSGFLRSLLLPNKLTRKFDAKLGKQFKSLKWCDRTFLIMPSHLPNGPKRCKDQKMGRQFKLSK